MRNVLIAMFVLFPQILCLFFLEATQKSACKSVLGLLVVNFFDYEVQWLKNQHKVLVYWVFFFFFLNDYGCGNLHINSMLGTNFSNFIYRKR